MVTKKTPAARTALPRFGAIMNTLIAQLSQTRVSVLDALPACAARGCTTFFMEPRAKGRKGVFAATEALPSPVRRHPGREPTATYVPSADDAGAVADAYVPTV